MPPRRRSPDTRGRFGRYPPLWEDRGRLGRARTCQPAARRSRHFHVVDGSRYPLPSNMGETISLDDYTTLPGKSGATHSISPCIAKLRVNENSVIFRETRNRWFIRIEKVLNPNGSPPRATPDLTPLLSSPAPGREKDEPSGQVTVKWFIKVRTFYLEPSASERQNGAPTGR